MCIRDSSQGLAGAGTPGEAVDKFGLNPMHPEISDELFWNLKLQESIVKLGKKKGLNINKKKENYEIYSFSIFCFYVLLFRVCK